MKAAYHMIYPLTQGEAQAYADFIRDLLQELVTLRVENREQKEALAMSRKNVAELRRALGE